jgi:2-methylcitrate dehydratase PrpD
VNDARRTGVTEELARFVAESRWSSIPGEINHEAKRALLNWAGCAIGGCRDEAVDAALAALSEFAGPPQATVLGRGERMDILTVAALNGLSSNILDFDDTHLRTVIHPTVPVAAAVIALAERSRVTGARLLHAFVLGIEVECRIGNAISPEHYNAGWHITATCGIFGAAAACAKLLDLDAKATAWALGLAANQAAGTTGAHGSMTKSWNMANAARNGLMAALLAANGFTSTGQALEGERGFTRVFAQRRDLDEITDGLGKKMGARTQRLQALSMRHRLASGHRRLSGASRRRTPRGGRDRAHRIACPPARANADGECGPAHRARSQAFRSALRSRSAHLWRGRRARVHGRVRQ